MQRTLTLLACGLATVSAFDSVGPVDGTVTIEAASTATSYNYKEDKGPDVWHLLDPAWGICQSGLEQSPIDIVAQTTVLGVQTPILFNYGVASGFSVSNTGKTLIFNDLSPNSMSIDGRVFTLLQMHMHSRSEHTFNGGSFPVEMHFVHIDADGALAVVGVMAVEGAENPAFPIDDRLRQIFPDAAGTTYSQPTFGLRLLDLLPTEGTRSYYHYNGSLTTPPCSEDVRWHVMQNPVTFSREQLKILVTSLENLADAGEKGETNRPVQPLNGRTVVVGQSPFGLRPAAPATGGGGPAPAPPAQNVGLLNFDAISTATTYDWTMGPNGPANWSAFAEVCGTGQRQSPIDIDIDTVQPGIITPITLSYGNPDAIVINNGHTIQFDLELDGFADIGNLRCNLLQAHLHHSSEHLFSGGSFPMELHFVHECPSIGQFAVLGVMITEGAPNAAFADLRQLDQMLPRDTGITHTFSFKIENILSLFPSDLSFYHYKGSLTTPPCLEAVEWHVFREPITFSKDQMSIFLDRLQNLEYASETGLTNRPVQPLFGRTVYLGYPLPGDDPLNNNGTVEPPFVPGPEPPQAVGTVVLEGADPTKTSYNYDDSDKGPAVWHTLDPAWAICQSGLQQSPIDIVQLDVVRGVDTAIVFNYSPAPFSVTNTGVSLVFDFAAVDNTVVIGGRSWNLVQFHVHTLSEHAFNGGLFPMEIHFVHADELGNLAVLGVQVREGAFNPAFPSAGRLAQIMPDEEGVAYRTSELLTLDSLFPADRSFYHYMGSLTTPPCSENVVWHVFTNPIEMATAQLDVFLAQLNAVETAGPRGQSNRPLQPLNGRTVTLGYTAEGPPVGNPATGGAAPAEIPRDEGVLTLDQPATTTDWNYQPDKGPAVWHTLDPAWAICQSGLQQSPIDIVESEAVGGVPTPFAMQYGPTGVDISNNGKTLVMNSVGGNTLEVGGTNYSMFNIHFHHISEHLFNGGGFDAEIHFVHVDGAGNLAVLGVMVVEGEANPGFPSARTLRQMLPGTTGVSHTFSTVTVDPSLMFPADMTFYNYPGSLTTPPCSEGVNWHVFRNPITMSREQLDILIGALRGLEKASMFGNTNRPVQPLNGRVVSIGYPNGDPTSGVSSIVANVEFDFEYFSASPAAQAGFTFALVEQAASLLAVARSGVTVTDLANMGTGTLVSISLQVTFGRVAEVETALLTAFSAANGWDASSYGEGTVTLVGAPSVGGEDDDDDKGLSDDTIAVIVTLVIMFSVIILANFALWHCLLKNQQQRVVIFNRKGESGKEGPSPMKARGSATDMKGASVVGDRDSMVGGDRNSVV